MSLHKGKNIEELLPIAARTSTANGGAVDVRKYDGIALFTHQSAAGTGTTPTLGVKLQDSADGSTGWADIPGATFAQVTDAADTTELIQVNLGNVKRYIRAVATIGGTTPSFTGGVSMIAEREQGYNSTQAA